MRIRTPLAAAAIALALTACKPIAADTRTEPAGAKAGAGAVVSGSSFSRSNGRQKHYAECTTPTGQEYRVTVSAATAKKLRDGQPCPQGQREPMPKDKHPELYAELQKRLPYGGGDANSDCGAWQTVDKAEARQMAKRCPPLKWGDLR